MFLSHSGDFMSILGIDKESIQVCSRNIAHWFQDIQTLLDHEDSENGQLSLISLSELIYEKEYILDALDLDDIRREASALEAQARRKVEETFFPSPEHKLLTETRQREYTKIVTDIKPWAKETALRHREIKALHTYNSILGELWQIADICNTLSMAKAQMRAFEIQQKKNTTSVPLDYQIADIPETTLNALCDLKYNQQYFLNGWNKEKFLSECKTLWESCKKQPISLVLLPILLTILMVEEVAHKNLYAYLKQTKRYLSIDSKAKIAQLYDDVCEVLRLGYKDCMNWWIPIFNWREIEKRFYEYNKLSTDDQKEAHYYLCKLRYKNGLSKQEERELAQRSYGVKLQALAKICNLNCFMMLALQTPEEMESPNSTSQMEPPKPNGQGIIIPAKAKLAYKLLMSDQILPREKGVTKTFDSYFKQCH